jgi:hypothetical protein
MSGEHAKKELINREKPRSSRKKNEGKTLSRPVTSTRRTRKNPPAPSNHTRRATRRKRR